MMEQIFEESIPKCNNSFQELNSVEDYSTTHGRLCLMLHFTTDKRDC